MAENVGAAEVLPQISQIITDVRVRRPSTESTDFRSKSTFKGVHLSQVHQPNRWHQPSKKCTNQARSAPTEQEIHQPSKKCTVSLVGAAETAAPPEKCASTD